MGATSSEILHLLKVKLPLKITTDGLSCFLGFQNFPGEDPRTPLPDQEMWSIFQSNTAQCKVMVGFAIDLWWDGYIFVA